MARNKHPEETVELILEQSLKLFMEKGYDGTSIQDIIRNLGGLSKGAIYHHFKSKEVIFDAVCERLGMQSAEYFIQLRDDKKLTGIEKIKIIFESAYTSSDNVTLRGFMVKMMEDPKFIVNQTKAIYAEMVPLFVEPIIKQCIDEGSVVSDYPKELGEVIFTLTNVWINPIRMKMSDEDIISKIDYFALVLKSLGLDIFDDDLKSKYIIICKQFNQYCS